jgi:hypothetical protein
MQTTRQQPAPAGMRVAAQPAQILDRDDFIRIIIPLELLACA